MLAGPHWLPAVYAWRGDVDEGKAFLPIASMLWPTARPDEDDERSVSEWARRENAPLPTSYRDARVFSQAAMPAIAAASSWPSGNPATPTAPISLSESESGTPPPTR